MIDVFNDEFIKFSHEGDIIYGLYKSKIINKEVVEHAIKIRHKFFADKDYLVILDITNCKTVTKAARKISETPKSLKGIKALAVITSSLSQKIIVNLFLEILQAPFPTKIFNNKEEATSWISALKD